MSHLVANDDASLAAMGGNSLDFFVPALPNPPTSPIDVRTPPERDQVLIDPWAFIRSSPPWLLSAVVHMIVVIVLGLWLTGGQQGDGMVSLEGSFDESLDNLDVEMSAALDMPQVTLDSVIIETEMLAELSEPIDAAEIVPVLPDASSLAMLNLSGSIGNSLLGRESGTREGLLADQGGTQKTEDAVIEGLRWLVRNQNSQGYWSLKGPYRNGSSSENREAATAMALLTFQGHGHVHNGPRNDPFNEATRQGWRWLLKQQHDDGHFFVSEARDGKLYTHAQCTIAICELYAMTRDPDLRRPAQRAIDYCVAIQTREGGWRYDPGTGSDLSVTGWFAMALQSARMAGLEVPSSTFDRLSKYLDSVQKEYGSQYSYRPNEGAKLSMTAEGLLCRQYLGWERDDQRLLDGTGLLVQNLPSWDDQNVYYWYYATQVCHHMGGDLWEKWNLAMREMLPKHQQKRGRERGSWDPDRDRWGAAGGRLYTTCLSIYVLEVYYRHLPLYGGAGH